MMYDIFITLVHNAALLITLAYAYSLISVQERTHTPLWIKGLLGVVVSSIGLSVMLTSWELDPGIVLDTRSVLLSGAGLFLGFVPTVTAMVVTTLFHYAQGSPGVAPGALIAIASGSLGLLWRHHRQHILVDISWRELYLFGLTVHVLMVASFLVLPWSLALPVLRKASPPILILFPLASMLFGRMMSYRLKRERDAMLLKESEERYRTLFENNHTSMFIIDPDSDRLVDANSAAESFYGWDREVLRGKTFGELLAGDDAEPVDEVVIPPSSGQAPAYELFRHRLATGELRLVAIYSGPITIHGAELRYAIVHDVTELKRMEAELRQAQKMEAVGRLAGGVAHDYNNKLQAILGFVELALERTRGQPNVRGYLEEVRDAGQRAAQLTGQLMAFARKQPIRPSVQNINQVIGRMLKMIKKLIGEDIDLEWKPGAQLWRVKTDATQIDQVLVNLALNARDAMSDVGKLTIETGNAVIEEGCRRMNPDASPGEYVMVAVTDNGCGMSRDQIPLLFEPFYTTKEVGKGTGLGLATVYGIIRQNHGFIDVHSEPGHGTSFKLYLPQTSELEDHDAEQPQEPVSPAGGRETILLVEDDMQVLDLAQRMLDGFGYTVLPADSPGAAEAVVSEHAGEIALMVTDVVMPTMNGRILHEILREKCVGLKVLYISGYTANAIIHRGILDKGVRFLQKPFSARELAAAVRETLDQDCD